MVSRLTRDTIYILYIWEVDVIMDNIYFRQVVLQPVGETVEINKDSHNKRESNFIDLLKESNESNKKVEGDYIPQTLDVDVMKQSLIVSYAKLANIINEKKEEKDDERRIVD